MVGIVGMEEVEESRRKEDRNLRRRERESGHSEGVIRKPNSVRKKGVMSGGADERGGGAFEVMGMGHDIRAGLILCVCPCQILWSCSDLSACVCFFCAGPLMHPRLGFDSVSDAGVGDGFDGIYSLRNYCYSLYVLAFHVCPASHVLIILYLAWPCEPRA